MPFHPLHVLLFSLLACFLIFEHRKTNNIRQLACFFLFYTALKVMSAWLLDLYYRRFCISGIFALCEDEDGIMLVSKLTLSGVNFWLPSVLMKLLLFKLSRKKKKERGKTG